MFEIIAIVVTVLAQPHPSVRLPEPKVLTLTLAATREIVPAEPLLVVLVLANGGDRPVAYDRSWRNQVQYLRRTAGGPWERVGFGPFFGRLRPAVDAELAPGKSEDWEQWLVRHTSDPSLPCEQQGILFSRPGDFQMKAVLAGRSGSIESSPVDVTVRATTDAHAVGAAGLLSERRDAANFLEDGKVQYYTEELDAVCHLGPSEAGRAYRTARIDAATAQLVKLINLFSTSPHADYARLRLGEYYERLCHLMPDLSLRRRPPDPAHYRQALESYNRVSNRNPALAKRAALHALYILRSEPDLAKVVDFQRLGEQISRSKTDAFPLAQMCPRSDLLDLNDLWQREVRSFSDDRLERPFTYQHHEGTTLDGLLTEAARQGKVPLDTNASYKSRPMPQSAIGSPPTIRALFEVIINRSEKGRWQRRGDGYIFVDPWSAPPNKD